MEVSSKDLNIDIEFAEEDFRVIPECKQYYVVNVNGPEQKPVTVDIWSYACYFFANVQKKQITENSKYIDGIRLDRYMELFCKDGGVLKLPDFIAEFPRHNFQKEMQSRYGVHVNVFALYVLCLYVKEIISRRLCILFKPTAKDTIEELGDAENIKDIQFSCAKGQIHKTNSEQLREILWKSLQELRESNSNEYEFDRVARCIDIFTKEYEKVEFVRMMSEFFHNFFSIKRRKNGYISAEEQRMLAFLLYFFDFTPAVVTESMIKKLLNSKMKIAESMLNLNFFGMPQCSICVEFIPYSVWKNGRIDPFEYKPIAANSTTGKEHFTLKMGSDKERLSEIIEIVKVIRDCFT